MNVDLEWEWIDFVPLDFYRMDSNVKKLFVRDIILQQIGESRPEIVSFERQIRRKEDRKISYIGKKKLIQDFKRWHLAIDDFQDFCVGKHKERLEVLNSTFDTWPARRVRSFIQQLEEKRSKSVKIGYIECLKNLQMVAMEIVTGSL